MNRSWWWFLNPMQWLKDIYEAFGVPYPAASLIVVTILGAIVAGGVWIFAAKQYQKDHPKPVVELHAAPTPESPAANLSKPQPAPTPVPAKPAATPTDSVKKKESTQNMKDEIPKVPPGSVVSINQSGGITAGQINITGPPPVKVNFVEVSLNAPEDRPEGKVYKTSIRILVSGFVPRLIVAVSAPSLIDVALLSDSGTTLGAAWPTKDGTGKQAIDNINGSCMLYLRSKAPEHFNVEYICQGVQCIGS